MANEMKKRERDSKRQKNEQTDERTGEAGNRKFPTYSRSMLNVYNTPPSSNPPVRPLNMLCVCVCIHRDRYMDCVAQ